MTAPPSPTERGLSTAAGDRWRELLSHWAIPAELLADAPDDPFRIPADLFDPEYQRCAPASVDLALDACPPGGSVLDVGCASGAASIPLAAHGATFTGVDADAEMAALFERTCAASGVTGRAIQGRWPEVAGRVDVHDVVVSHHVVYNVAEIERFLLELTAHARRRVVLEVTPDHPQSELNPLWLQLHQHVRPTTPTVDDLHDVLRSLGITAQQVVSRRPPPPTRQPRDRIVAFARRRLCLGPGADEEVDRLLPPDATVPPPPVCCVWWDGRALVPEATPRVGLPRR